MSMEQENNFNPLEAPDFQTIKKMSLDQADFQSKLKGMRKMEIQPLTYSTFILAANTFTEEKTISLEESFRAGFEARAQWKAEWDKFSFLSGNDPVFSSLQVSANNMFVFFSIGFKHTLQSLSYMSECNKKLATALESAYRGKPGISDAEKETIIELASQLRRASEKINSIAELYK